MFAIREHAGVEITFTRSALKGLADMPASKREEALAVLRRIAAERDYRNNNLKPLRGIKGGFRLRAGDWRINFTRDAKAGEMEVFEVAPRGGAYR